MNGKVTDANQLLERAYLAGMDKEFRDDLRSTLDALTCREPTKPEAVRLRDELRERAAFENWAENQFVLTRKDAGYLSTLTTYSWEAWQAALASVQPSPAGQGDALSVRTAYAIATSWREQASKLKVGRATLIRCAAELEAALAARHPVGHEPVGVVDDAVMTRSSRDLPGEGRYISAVKMSCELPPGTKLYAGPPAQAVDLDQLRNLQYKIEGWSKSEPHLQGWEAFHRCAIYLCGAIDQMIDSEKAVQS